MHSAVQVHRPEWNSMFCVDQEQARASRQWLLAHAADTGETVFAADFAETSAGMVVRVGDGFEWRYAKPQPSNEA